MERDKFMSPADAKAFGIIDEILDHPPKIGVRDDNNLSQSVAG